MISLSIHTDFPRAERALLILARDQVPYAASRALNDCARAAVEKVNGAMSSVFDRPTPFTERTAVAPGSLAALKDRLAAVVTLRPIPAKYLLHEEIGGTRTLPRRRASPAGRWSCPANRCRSIACRLRI